MARIEQTVAVPATIDLNRVATLVRVVDAGSFTAAARTLGRPKSSVSRSIKRLEEDLGLTLLQRTTRKLTLTRAGDAYLGSAREALRMLDESHRELVNADAAPSGTIRLSAPIDPTARIGGALAAALTAFMARYPGVYVETIFTGRRVDLIAEGVDLALRAGKLDDSSLVARKLADDGLGLIAAPAYLKQYGTPRRLSDLAQHRAILFKGVQGSARWHLAGPKGSESVVVHGQVSVDEMGFMLRLLENGAGIALLPLLIAEEGLASGRLVRVLPQYKRKEGALYLVYPAERHAPRRVTLLREFLYEALKRDFARPLR